MNYAESPTKAFTDHVSINKKYLLDTIMNQCGITDKDLSDTSVVKSKVRNAKLGNILDDNSNILNKSVENDTQ